MTVVVTVRDATTRGPMRALVALDGPVSVSDLSDVDGYVRFVALAPGGYTVKVARYGYLRVSKRFRAYPGTVVQIAVSMERIAHGPRVIAVVKVRASNPDGIYLLKQRGATSALEPSTLSSLSSVAGLFLNNPTSPGSGLFVSLEGQSASETALSLDGVPLNVPGTAFNLSTVDPDVFRSAVVRYGVTGSGEGGTLSFRTLDPTTTWQTQFEGSAGPYGRSFLTFSEQGTSGRLGFAFQHAFRSNASPLSNQAFADSSGLYYTHLGEATTSGTVAKLRYNFGHNVLSATGVESSNYSDLLCDVFTNSVPCGYGPGNSTNGSFGMVAVSDQASIGQTIWTATAFRLTSLTGVDLSNFILDRLPLPSTSNTLGISSGVSFRGDIPIGSTQGSISVTQSANLQRESDSSLGAVSTVARLIHYMGVRGTDRFRVSKKASVAVTSAFKSLGLVGTSTDIAVSATLQHSLAQVSSLTLAVGRGLNQDGTQTLLTSPLGLQYNCNASMATGQSPGDSASEHTLSAARYTWNAQLPKGEITFQTYAEDQPSASLVALVNAGALPASTFPGGYFALAKTLYQLPTNCGATATFDPRNLYFLTNVSGVHLLFEGAHVTGSRQLRRNLVLEGNLTWTKAIAWSTDPRLTYPQSIFRSGDPLLGIPQLSGYLALAYEPHNEPQFYLGAQYDGYGNARALPPSTVVNAAVVTKLRRGQLSLLVGNIFNSYSGTFATPTFARPLFAGNGTPIPGISQPYEPRSVTVTYSAGIGRDVRANNLIGKTFLSSETNNNILVPGTLIEKWPLSRPTNPFIRNTASKCTANKRKRADSVLNPLQALVARLDKSRPSTSQVFPPIGSLQVHYLPIRRTYALSLRATRIKISQAMLDCALIHVGIQANAEAASLPFPPAQSLVSITLYYTPQVGIYFIQQPPAKGEAQKFRYYALPSTPPSAPFALQGADLCLPELRPVAVRLLDELKAYFSAAKPNTGLAPDWKIVRHGSKTARAWYELQTDEIGAVTAIRNCAHLSKGSLARLKSRDLAGRINALNYAVPIGLYVVTP